MEITETLARLIGAAGGAVVGVVFIWPRTRREALSRLVVSMICGILLEDHVEWWLKVPESADMTMGNAAIGAAMSWWVIGVGVRLARHWGEKQDSAPKG